MSKQAWMAHMKVDGGVDFEWAEFKGPGSPEWKAFKALHFEHLDAGCKPCRDRQRTRKATRNRKERDGVMRDLGMVKTPYGWE